MSLARIAELRALATRVLESLPGCTDCPVGTERAFNGLHEALDGWERAIEAATHAGGRIADLLRERDEAEAKYREQQPLFAAWDEATEDAKKFATQRDEARELVKRLLSERGDFGEPVGTIEQGVLDEADAKLREWGMA